MNQNQLVKALRRNPAAYNNIDGYREYLRQSALFKISLSHLENQQEMVRQFRESARQRAYSLPLDNIFFDVRGHAMPDLLTGQPEIQSLGIHMMPVEISMKGIIITCLLVLDFRRYGKEVMHRSYFVYGDMAGLHIMPSATRAALNGGCACFRENVFWTQPAYQKQITDRMPCSVDEVGFSLPDCSAPRPACAYTISQKSDIAHLISLLLGYVSLPSNHLFKVTAVAKRRKEQYYISIDDNQIERLQDGSVQAEILGNNFTDGSLFSEEISKAAQAPNAMRFERGGRVYEFISK